MRDGSLYRLVQKFHNDSGKLFDLSCGIFDQDHLLHAIRARVEQRFAFLDDMAKYKAAGFVLNQEFVNRIADEHGVPAPALPAAPAPSNDSAHSDAATTPPAA
jgi:hypothetical protein